MRDFLCCDHARSLLHLRHHHHHHHFLFPPSPLLCAADAYQANVDLAFCCGCTAQLVADGWAAQGAARPTAAGVARREIWQPSADVAAAAAAAAAHDDVSSVSTGNLPRVLPGVAGVPYAALPQHPYNASAVSFRAATAALPLPGSSLRLGQDPILADFLTSHETVYNARTRTYFSSMGPAADGRIKVRRRAAPGASCVVKVGKYCGAVFVVGGWI